MTDADQLRSRADAIQGCILGTAVGDSIGLPREGLSARRAEKMFSPAPLRHRLLFGRGMVSDDTEHTCMVAQALLASGGEPDRFARSLAWRLRGWLLGLPAGAGAATLRAILKLWMGFPPSRSGVWSAGNGPAMRAAILGVWAGDHSDRFRALVRASTRLTHTDPDAEYGALAVALAARYGADRGPKGIDAVEFLQSLQTVIPPGRLMEAIQRIPEHLARGAAPGEYAHALGLKNRISGYINHTVPVALYCWLRWPGDFRTAVEQVIVLGGDADTTAAIAGAISGATIGAQGIPQEWIDGIAEWPRTINWMRALAGRLSDTVPGETGRPLPVFLPGVLLRNLFFLMVVLVHAFRRLLPPY